MKFFILLFFVGLAVSRAEICGKERAEKCVEKLMEVVLGDESGNEACRELENSLNCLQEAAADCLEQISDEIDDGLNQMQSILRDNCQEEDDEDEEEEGLSVVDKCFQDNEDYIKECEFESAARLIYTIFENGDVDDDGISCLAYHFMLNCVIERVEEKCDEEAKEEAEEKLQELPEDVKKACDAGRALDVL